MLDYAVKNWDKNKTKLEEIFSVKHPDSYDSIFEDLIKVISDEDEYDEFNPDIKRLNVIDHGDYQGNRLFVIGAKGYQPSKYWACLVSYGSCSGCDTFEGIKNYSDDTPTKDQVSQYMNLALHMVQSLKEIT